VDLDGRRGRRPRARQVRLDGAHTRHRRHAQKDNCKQQRPDFMFVLLLRALPRAQDQVEVAVQTDSFGRTRRCGSCSTPPARPPASPGKDVGARRRRVEPGCRRLILACRLLAVSAAYPGAASPEIPPRAYTSSTPAVQRTLNDTPRGRLLLPGRSACHPSIVLPSWLRRRQL